MSGLDPLAALAADVALTQSSIAAIDLGIQIEVLQSQLSIGDLITATILPAQDGSDRLSFLGQTVLAQLPPGIDPGQSLLLQVTGFSGNQILVRNIGVVDPANPPPTVTVSLPPPAPGTPAQATLVTVSNPQPAAANQSAASAVPANAAGNAIVTQSAASKEIVTQSAASAASGVEGQPPVAPPRAVFVAASVQPAAPTAEPLPPGVTALPEEIGIEARIVATRAAAIDLSELVAQPAQPAAKAPLPTAPVRATPVRAAQTPVIPPRITPAGTAPPTPVRAETIAPELALLARLRIPSLPFTLGAARIATNAASILPRALARLDAALAALAQGDARASTLRTIAGFITRIDPSNARALPEQLMAYIGNVVEGAESKLASILRALTPEAEPPPVNVGTSAPASTTAPG
ncbi:MAG: hypothetical protein JO160_03785, partial [Candidatus Eremiobacteraeota bacterium]|nr:hypothetical protein [Candidatus Eremiobacteraeota bacterium]